MSTLQKSHRELYDAILHLTSIVDNHLFHLENEVQELSRYPALQLAGNAINDRTKKLADTINGLSPIMQRAREAAKEAKEKERT